MLFLAAQKWLEWYCSREDMSVIEEKEGFLLCGQPLLSGWLLRPEDVEQIIKWVHRVIEEATLRAVAGGSRAWIARVRVWTSRSNMAILWVTQSIEAGKGEEAIKWAEQAVLWAARTAEAAGWAEGQGERMEKIVAYGVTLLQAASKATNKQRG